MNMLKMSYNLVLLGCLSGTMFLLSCGSNKTNNSTNEESEIATDSILNNTADRAYEMYKLIPKSDLPSRCRNLVRTEEFPIEDDCSFESWYTGSEEESGYTGTFSLMCLFNNTENQMYVCYTARGGYDGLYDLEGNGIYLYKDGKLEKKNIAFPKPGIREFFEDDVNLLGIKGETKKDVFENYASRYYYTFVPSGDESLGGVMVGLDLSYLTYGVDDGQWVSTPTLFYEIKDGAFVRNKMDYLDGPMYILEPSGIGGENGYSLGSKKHKDVEALPSFKVKKKDDILLYTKDHEVFFSSKIENDYITEISIFTRKISMMEDGEDGYSVEYKVGSFLDDALINGFSETKSSDGKFHAEKIYDKYIVELIADDKDAIINEIHLKLTQEALQKVLSEKYPIDEIWKALPEDYRRDTTTAISSKMIYYKAGDGCELRMKDYDETRYCYMMKCIQLDEEDEYEVYVAVYSWKSQRANETLDELNRVDELNLDDVYCYSYKSNDIQQKLWTFDKELDMDIKVGCKVFHFDEGLEQIKVTYQKIKNDSSYEQDSVAFVWNRPTEKFL